MYLSATCDVLIPHNRSTPGSRCACTSFISSVCSWAGNLCSFGSILLRFLASCCLPLLEGGSRILPRWISGCGGLNLKLYILLRLGLIAMKACAPFLRSVGSSSVVHPFLPEGGLVSFNSCSRARRGYTAWAHPIFLLPFSWSSWPYILSGSVSCDIRTRVGKVRWMASRRVG